MQHRQQAEGVAQCSLAAAAPGLHCLAVALLARVFLTAPEVPQAAAVALTVPARLVMQRALQPPGGTVGTESRRTGRH